MLPYCINVIHTMSLLVSFPSHTYTCTMSHTMHIIIGLGLLLFYLTITKCEFFDNYCLVQYNKYEIHVIKFLFCNHDYVYINFKFY